MGRSSTGTCDEDTTTKRGSRDNLNQKETTNVG